MLTIVPTEAPAIVRKSSEDGDSDKPTVMHQEAPQAIKVYTRRHKMHQQTIKVYTRRHKKNNTVITK